MAVNLRQAVTNPHSRCNSLSKNVGVLMASRPNGDQQDAGNRSHDPFPRLQQAITRDRALVDRCLAGRSSAWDELYRRHHSRLLAAIRAMIRSPKPDVNLTEEIAARVWYALVANNAQLLDRFDVKRGCRLSTYLAMIARSEASSLFRSERRRRKREQFASRADRTRMATGEGSTRIDWQEFLPTLTPREREFLLAFLVAHPQQHEKSMFSATNRWQLSSRIQHKLERHMAPYERDS